ncbi:MAG: AAA family ATPase [Acetobacteraceae bacterium]|nr:AAA family ATPase [Acetobacteraceae bacterium]
MALLTEALPIAASLTPYVSALLRANIARGAAVESLHGAVLLLDIVDSTGLANRYAAEGPEGAERLGEALATHLRPVFDLVAARGGDIVAMEGDSITAVWRDTPELPPASGRAAATALALRDLLEGKAIRQRIVVAAGALHALPLSLGNGRNLFLLAGPPLRALGALAADCPPNQVLLAAGIEPSPEIIGPPAEIQCPDAMLAPYLPAGISARTALAGSGWSTEFRIVTAILLRLDGFLPETDDGAPLSRVLQLIQETIAGLGLGIFEVIEGDKGTIIGIFAGLPPFVLDQNAAGALEAARRIAALLEAQSIPFGIGIATGRAFTSEVGSDRRRLQIMLGPVMSLAARLMQVSRSAVLADPETVVTAGAQFSFGEPFLLSTKGRADPVPVRRLLGRSAARTAAALPERGSLIGRGDEEAHLAAFLDHAPGGLAMIVGEAGVGKSRLLAQALRLAQERGRLIVPAAAQAIEQDTAYFALRSILTHMLGLTDQAAPADVALRLRECFPDQSLLGRAEALTDILPIDVEALGPQQPLSGAARPAAVTEIMLRLIKVQDQPTLLLLDDIQWLDGSSAQTISALLRRAPGLLAIAGCRPLEAEVRPEIRSLVAMAGRSFLLSRLDRAATAELVRGFLGVSAVPARLAEFIYDRSEGLPLHAEQLLLVMRERGMLHFSPDGRQVEVVLSSDTGIETLRDVILRRVDRLPAEQQLVLKVASVLGRTLDPALLTALHPEGSLPQGAVQVLEESGLLQREGKLLAFRHIRIQEAVYDLLPFAQRRNLHRAAAEATEGIHRQDLDQHCALLAAHWERAGEPARGATWRLRAAARALGSAAHLDALAHLRAVAAQGGYEKLFPDLEQRRAYAQVFGLAADEASDFETAHAWLMDYARLCGVRVPKGGGTTIGRIMMAVFKQALLRARLLRPQRNPESVARAAANSSLHWRLAEHAYFKGDTMGVLHGQLVALNEAEFGLASRDMAIASGGLSIALSLGGMRNLAHYYQSRAITLGETTDTWTQGMAYLLAAVQATTIGDWPRTIRQSEIAADIFTSIGEHYRFVTSTVMLTYGRLAVGELTAARDLLLPFGEFAEALDNPPARGWTLIARALMDLMSGASPAIALERLDLVQEKWLSAGERVMWHCLFGAAAFAAGDHARATHECDIAIGLMRNILGVGHAYHAVSAMVAACQAMAQDGKPQSKARAAEALFQARRFAQRISAGRPYIFWLEGRAARMNAAPNKAARRFRRGLALAERLGMPYEAALCLRALDEPKRAEARLASTGMIPWIEFDMRIRTP